MELNMQTLGNRRTPFRLTSALVTVSLVLGPALPVAAQDAAHQPASTAPPLPVGAEGLAAPGSPLPATTAEADPPARVGRVARVSGTVSYHPATADQWEPAQMNWPVTSGSAFWTEPNGSAELELPSGRIGMAGGSELDVERLDAQQLAATVRQGDVYVRPTSLAPGEIYHLQSPRGLVTIATPGRYEIFVGDTEHPTRVTVFEGAAEIGEGSTALQAVAGQAIVLAGNDNFTMQVEPAGPDRFLARFAPPPVRRRQAVAPPPVVAAMPGGADLAQYGSWEPSPQYGPVWYPQVSPGWVPYRTGHWAYILPWGWTWIDAAPWGFAPFHYGRWFEAGGRWGWTPGGYVVAEGPVYALPVYAPALVTFFGVGMGVGLAGGYGNVGWLPLGPREPFHPWYRTSPAYVRNVNYLNVTNITNNTYTNSQTTNLRSFHNVAAATQVPVSVMTASRPVGPSARPLPPAQFGHAQPLAGPLPVRPGVATAGITPAIARQLNIAPANGQVPPGRRPAPGPAILGRGAPVQAVPAQGVPVQGLRLQPPGAPVARPGAAAAPGITPGLASRPPAVAPPAAPRPTGFESPGVASPGAAIRPGVPPSVPPPRRVPPPQRALSPMVQLAPGQPPATQSGHVAPGQAVPGHPGPAGSSPLPNQPQIVRPAAPAQPPVQPRYQPPAQPAQPRPPPQPQPHYQPPPVQPRYQPPPQPHYQAPPVQPRYQPPPQPVQPRPQPQPHFQPPPPPQQQHAPPPSSPSHPGKRPGEP